MMFQEGNSQMNATKHDLKTQTIPDEVKNAQVIFVSHSGGKDSQAMLAHLVSMGLRDKIVLVHSDLGEMEWEPMEEFIKRNSFGLEVHVVRPKLSFFDLCRKYRRIPGGRARFCTMYLKTEPIGEFIHDYMTRHGLTLAINATGVRAEESRERAKKSPLGLSSMTMSRKYPGHIITDWLPVFDFTLQMVWDAIAKAGQTPNPIYAKGFSRLSCVFCVFGRIGEHQAAAKLRPDLFNKMAALEKELGKSIRVRQVDGKKQPKFLGEYC